MCADSKHNEHRVILKYQILQWTCFLGKVSCTGNLPSQKWNEMRKMEPYASVLDRHMAGFVLVPLCDPFVPSILILISAMVIFVLVKIYEMLLRRRARTRGLTCPVFWLGLFMSVSNIVIG